TTTNTTTVPTTTTRALNYTQVTLAGDPIAGIYNAAYGGSSTNSSAGSNTAGTYPSSENPPNCIDSNTNTKYLNYGANFDGYNTGFYVMPQVGSSIATGILFATGNDHSERDPITITIEGSNAAASLLERTT
ncbi:unnamed protein product, partial [Didymodactylos carnosus]